MTRPRKSATAKAKRQARHKARLIAYGLDEASLKHMNAADLRAALKREAILAAKKARA